MDKLQTCLPSTIFLIFTLGNLLLRTMENEKLDVSAIPYIVMYAGILQLLCSYGYTGLAWALLLSITIIPVIIFILILVLFLVFGKDLIEQMERERERQKWVDDDEKSENE